jgi:G:T/U-mismatch repair DNA glycosylase
MENEGVVFSEKMRPKQAHFVTETMPIPPFLEGNPNALIIGTFPPAANRWDYPFFFPNKQNRLWNTLARVAKSDENFRLADADNEAQEVEIRKEILRSLDVAMVNIIHQCSRKNGSALDNDLEVFQLENIVENILRKTSSIRALFLTSKSGKNSCLSLLRSHLAAHNIRLQIRHKATSIHDKRLQAPDQFAFTFDGREIMVYSLFSPSPTSLRAGITEAALYGQYQIIRSL